MMDVPDVIDLRSDTVTRPTPEMREAMFTCEVGDDVFGDDPTVIQLEELAAEMTGMEAALWCPTGTMANQVAVQNHTRPGQEVVMGNGCHIFNYELGGAGWNAFCQVHNISDQGGWPEPDTVKQAIREESMHTPGTGLLCLENTHNRRGGRVMPMEVLKACAGYAREMGIPVHLDGARIWNAATASGIPVPEYAREVDSLMFCLSKGLASPAGSMLCGSKGFIEKARRLRKRMGGGLRQAGILAACGLISLKKMVSRIDEDHRAAKELAESLKSTGVLDVHPELVDTNIIIFSPGEGATWTAEQFGQAAEKKGLLVTWMGSHSIRMVTHNDFDPAWTAEVVERVKKAVGSIG